jgi:hypothetical protein
VSKEIADARFDVDTALEDGAKPAAADPMAHDADGLPIASTGGDGGATAPLNGAAPPAPEPEVAGAEETGAPAETQKSGA